MRLSLRQFIIKVAICQRLMSFCAVRVIKR